MRHRTRWQKCPDQDGQLKIGTLRISTIRICCLPCEQMENEPCEDIVTITVVDGALSIRDDLKEYADRGSQLHDMNLLDFFLNTYETDGLQSSTSSRGRKPSKRIPYMDGTGHTTSWHPI